MKWVLIVIGAIILLPLLIRILLPILKAALKVIAWLLAVAFFVGGSILLIQGQILYGIIGLVLGGLLSLFFMKFDDGDVYFYV